MKKINIVVMVLSLLFIVLLVPPSANASEVTLKKRINLTVNKKLWKSDYSISVRDTKTQKVVYERNGNHGVKPASNMKLITAAAALDKLGGKYQFLTELLIDGDIKDGVLEGNVYLRGQGDPTFMQKDLVTFADALKKAGIQQVQGSLIGDATWFDSEFRMRGVVPNDESEWFAPQVAALTLSPDEDYDAGTVIVQATPGTRGRAARIALTPKTNYVTITNRTRTVSKGYRNTVTVKRVYGTNQIVVSGNLPIGGSSKEYVTVDNPNRYTLDVMKLAMQSRGIIVPKVAIGKVPDAAVRIAQKQSQPLNSIVQFNLKRSKNVMSEIFAKTLGQVFLGEGSYDAGFQVIKNYAASKGLHPERWKMADASGLSHQNSITANEQTLLLWSIRQEPYYNVILKGLPVAGNANKTLSTTLQKRLTGYMTRNKVFAKTGYITGTNSLSGYLQAKSGHWYTFSILTEGSSYTAATKTIDDIVTIIAKEL